MLRFVQSIDVGALPPMADSGATCPPDARIGQFLRRLFVAMTKPILHKISSQPTTVRQICQTRQGPEWPGLGRMRTFC